MQLIISYATPAGISLARHLTTHLSHQINFLISCRPLSVSQGNAIRGLKLLVSKVKPETPEDEAKVTLCDWIDNFINEKITLADQAIATTAAEKIKDGDVILCYAASNIVRRTLITAHEQGKKFRVSVIDSRPLFEGKHFARALVDAGLEVQYGLINGLGPATKDATKVFLGAHAMTSNGCLYSRVGTALVAMSAKDRARGINIPVIVLCETVKFTDRVALDSIVVNEIADPDELVASEKPWKITGGDTPAEEAKEAKSGGKSKEPAPAPAPKVLDPLENWKTTPNLQVLNIMHDVTPREYIDMVITEMGILPPSAVPTVHRMSTEHEEK
jgi:translation initiation factor eIF-2B subunit delta